MKNNYAFIDSQNLYLSVQSQGWKIDWKKFRTYLSEKYNIEKAYLFIGMIEGNNRLYLELQDAGFLCVWKPTLKYKDGTVKGNPMETGTYVYYLKATCIKTNSEVRMKGNVSIVK